MKRTIGVLLLAVAAVLLVRHFFPADESRIKKQLTRLAGFASRPADEKTLAGLTRAKAISELFARRARLDVAEAGLAGEYDRQEIRTLALLFRNRFSQVRIRCRDMTVELAGDRARLNATCRASGQAGGEAVRETREIRAGLVRSDGGDWLFTGLGFVEILER